MWVSPIYDRTETDIELKTKKAFINITDTNRVEGNSAHLAGLLGGYITTKAWTRLMFPTASDLSRIRANVALLRGLYYVRTSTPDTPDNPLNHWSKWNALERILFDLHDLYNQNLDAAFHTGEVFAGEGIGVI